MSTMTPIEPSPAAKSVKEVLRKPVKYRPTPLSARGEPAVWFMALSLILCVTLIAGLLGRVLIEGLKTFWPQPIERLTLQSGQVVMGIKSKDDVDPTTLSPRILLRTGNREVGSPFMWVDTKDIKSHDLPAEAIFVERREWGAWIGEPRAILKIETEAMPASGKFELNEIVGGKSVSRKQITGPDGKPVIEVTTTVAQGSAETWEAFEKLHGPALARFDQMHKLTQDELGWINSQIERLRLDVRQAEIDQARTLQGGIFKLNWTLWSILAGATALLLAGAFRLRKAKTHLASAARVLMVVFAIAAGIALVLENPWGNWGVTVANLEQIKLAADAKTKELSAQYQEVLKKIDLLKAEDLKYRFVVVESGGKFAPTRQSAPDDPMFLSQVVRAVRPNELSIAGKLGVYLSRWGEYLGDPPRDANTEGGVFPVIFGTVIMTLLLSLFVVPLGVIAALYLREYAKQGFITSLIRVAVNNLAGVPSIVYGVFGLGFFCYTIGAYVDHGPAPANVVGRIPWWWILAGLAVLVAFALATGGYLRRTRQSELSAFGRALAPSAAIAWIAAAILLGTLFVTTPYFHGFFEALQPSPTFGQRGLLWGSLTLAILTLPVVIVATEEAIAAVPKTMREGSYGAGASKWQTIWRIVLPQAMPGIMTGMILAMARGAGEVAPLMLVGAVKLAPDLPISSHAPFLHPERSFMHLGFHIYDLGFQSTDSEAARPLVWTTTLLLIVIVLLLNLAAITIRGRLRARLVGSAV